MVGAALAGAGVVACVQGHGVHLAASSTGDVRGFPQPSEVGVLVSPPRR